MILSNLSTTEYNELSPYLKEVKVNRGKYLFRPGDVADAVFILKSGKVGVQTSTGFEDRQQVVALLDPGAAIGEKGLTVEGNRGMTAVAIEDCVLYSFSKDAFSKLEKSNPYLALKILKTISERLAHVL